MQHGLQNVERGLWDRGRVAQRLNCLPADVDDGGFDRIQRGVGQLHSLARGHLRLHRGRELLGEPPDVVRKHEDRVGILGGGHAVVNWGLGRGRPLLSGGLCHRRGRRRR